VSRNYDTILERYIDRIVDGTIAAGAALPREQDVATEFSLSRGVAREALRALQERGLITVRHGSGQRVNDPRRWNVLDPQVLAALLTRADGDQLVVELVECRAICEPEAAARAAEHATTEDLDAIARCLAAVHRHPRLRRAHDLADLRAAERALHEAIVVAAGNRPLAQILRPILGALEAAGDVIPYRAEAAREREAIVAGLADRDPHAAREATRAHLEAVAQSLAGAEARRRAAPRRRAGDRG
jgi:DNA-binding FadR family transcriptional regulator